MVKKSEHEGRLAGKTAVIVGGSGGIGRGIVEDFVKEGARVVVADIAVDKAENLVEEINRQYGEGKAAAIYVDVTDEESVKRMVEKTVEIFGVIDILIYSAGVVKAGSVKSCTERTPQKSWT